MSSLNWTPIRRGKIYCAPACGGQCTFAAYREAQNRARSLAKKLGKGWTPSVWENIGWFYQVTSPDKMIVIHPRHACGGKSYFVSFDAPGVGQIATVSGTDLFDCLSELSNTLHQRMRLFETASATMKKFTANCPSLKAL